MEWPQRLAFEGKLGLVPAGPRPEVSGEHDPDACAVVLRHTTPQPSWVGKRFGAAVGG